MKKEYVSPLIICEKFQVDEYVAACGDSGTVYKFECNAGIRNNHYAIKDSAGRVATIAGKRVDGSRLYYHTCHATHEAESDSEFLTGYHLDDSRTWEDEEISVIIWVDREKDIHCTTNLDMNTWETAKS